MHPAAFMGNATVRDGSAFVVELPAGPMSRRAVSTHRRAIRLLTATLAANTPSARTAATKPTIHQHLIPFPESRVRAMRRYSQRHYGTPVARLSEPKQIVEHITAGGTYRSVRLRCRHTVGLNHVSIGIEHVARTDAEFLGNRRQLAASLRLTRWLQARCGIADADVIGHNESLGSRFHRERVARLRTQTHGDMTAATMRRYRGRL